MHIIRLIAITLLSGSTLAVPTSVISSHDKGPHAALNKRFSEMTENTDGLWVYPDCRGGEKLRRCGWVLSLPDRTIRTSWTALERLYQQIPAILAAKDSRTFNYLDFPDMWKEIGGPGGDMTRTFKLTDAHPLTRGTRSFQSNFPRFDNAYKSLVKHIKSEDEYGSMYPKSDLDLKHVFQAGIEAIEAANILFDNVKQILGAQQHGKDVSTDRTHKGIFKSFSWQNAKIWDNLEAAYLRERAPYSTDGKPLQIQFLDVYPVDPNFTDGDLIPLGAGGKAAFKELEALASKDQQFKLATRIKNHCVQISNMLRAPQ